MSTGSHNVHYSGRYILPNQPRVRLRYRCLQSNATAGTVKLDFLSLSGVTWRHSEIECTMLLSTQTSNSLFERLVLSFRNECSDILSLVFRILLRKNPHLAVSELGFLNQWASSTGLSAVSKFKPRLPAQWAVGTHRKGPSRMEKSNFPKNWPIRNSTQIRN